MNARNKTILPMIEQLIDKQDLKTNPKPKFKAKS